MDRIVFLANRIESGVVSPAVPDAEIVTVYDRRSLVEALVENRDLAGAIIEARAGADADDPDAWDSFLASVERSFPMLPLVILEPDADDEEVTASVTGAFASPRPRERREHHRYPWPLQARLECGESVHRIHEISAGGALLEPVAPIPSPGSECTIVIEFQNFRMKTTCEILDPRRSSSRSQPGFGVRFTSLSEPAERFIDGIVNDALARVLLDPSAAPAVPSIDEEEDILAVGDEFSLSL